AAAFAGQPAAAVTASQVMQWLEKQAWCRSTRWLAANTIKTLFRWAKIPLVGLSVPGPLSRGASSLIEPDEHERLLAAAIEPLRDALFALQVTGCRPCELTRVTAADFDADAGVWLLFTHKTDRTGKPRVVPLTPALVELCRRLATRHPTGP